MKRILLAIVLLLVLSVVFNTLRDYAAPWLRIVNGEGDAKDQLKLGFMYEKGKFVTQDDKEAVNCYRKAAEQGLAMGQVSLGTMYENGKGVPKDEKEAVAWYRKAAEQGEAVGQFYIGTMYAKGLGVPKDVVQAHMWCSLASAQDDKDALKKRDELAKQMTPAQIKEAEELAKSWKPVKK